MTDAEYTEQLEKLVKEYMNEDYAEWWYYDVLPQLPLKQRQAYYRAIGENLPEEEE